MNVCETDNDSVMSPKHFTCGTKVVTCEIRSFWTIFNHQIRNVLYYISYYSFIKLT